jgi:hypothetical protein
MEASDLVNDMAFGSKKESCTVTSGSNRRFEMGVVFVHRDSIKIVSCSATGVVFGGKGGRR